MGLDIQYNNLSAGVVPRVAKVLRNENLRKLGNILKLLKMDGCTTQCSIFPTEMNLRQKR